MFELRDTYSVHCRPDDEERVCSAVLQAYSPMAGKIFIAQNDVITCDGTTLTWDEVRKLHYDRRIPRLFIIVGASLETMHDWYVRFLLVCGVCCNNTTVLINHTPTNKYPIGPTFLAVVDPSDNVVFEVLDGILLSSVCPP